MWLVLESHDVRRVCLKPRLPKKLFREAEPTLAKVSGRPGRGRQGGPEGQGTARTGAQWRQEPAALGGDRTRKQHQRSHPDFQSRVGPRVSPATVPGWADLRWEQDSSLTDGRRAAHERELPRVGGQGGDTLDTNAYGSNLQFRGQKTATAATAFATGPG